MKPTLLILAAGLGSRFGGDKQVSHVGPNGELLMEYSIHDAINAGFKKVVFVLKEDMIATVKSSVGEKFKDRVELEYAVQDFSSLPAFYKVPEGRVKPFGTVHAVLCAKEFLTDPFVTVGIDGYKRVGKKLLCAQNSVNSSERFYPAFGDFIERRKA